MVDTAGQFCIPVLCSVQTSSRGLAWSLGGDGANSAQQIAKTFPPLSLSFSFSLFFFRSLACEQGSLMRVPGKFWRRTLQRGKNSGRLPALWLRAALQPRPQGAFPWLQGQGKAPWRRGSQRYTPLKREPLTRQLPSQTFIRHFHISIFLKPCSTPKVHQHWRQFLLRR